MGKHSDPNQSSWASSARTLVRDLSRVGRANGGRHSGTEQATTATGVIRTIKRKPMLAAIAIPAAATTAIVASSFALSPGGESGVVKPEQQAASSPKPENVELVDEQALAQQRDEAAQAYNESLKKDKKYQGSEAAVAAAAPKPSTSPAARAGAGQASRSDGRDAKVSNKPCSVSASIESGLQPVSVNGYRAICANFPEVKSYGGRRNDPGSDHHTGMAVDAMIRGSVGDQITKFLIDNHKELRVKYVIWEQKYFAPETGWKGKPMSNRGNDTQNHFDHVHVSFK